MTVRRSSLKVRGSGAMMRGVRNFESIRLPNRRTVAVAVAQRTAVPSHRSHQFMPVNKAPASCLRG